MAFGEEATWRTQELVVFDARRPIPQERHLGSDEPVKLIPGTDIGIVLFSPELVRKAAIDGDLVERAVRILVEIERKAGQLLRSQSRVGDQQATGASEVVPERHVEKAVNVRRRS